MIHFPPVCSHYRLLPPTLASWIPLLSRGTSAGGGPWQGRVRYLATDRPYLATVSLPVRSDRRHRQLRRRRRVSWGCGGRRRSRTTMEVAAVRGRDNGRRTEAAAAKETTTVAGAAAVGQCSGFVVVAVGEGIGWEARQSPQPAPEPRGSRWAPTAGYRRPQLTATPRDHSRRPVP